MLVGYARTSTVEQMAGFESQLIELRAAGCEQIYQEQLSSTCVRHELQAAIQYTRENDVLVVTKLDRLARSVSELLEIVNTLQAKKVSLRILNLGMDTQTPTGKLLLTILGSIAQFEREIMLERQREGIAKAKKEGKYKGRKPISSTQKKEIIELAQVGVTKRAIAKKFSVGEATVYRIIAEFRAESNKD